MYVRGGCEGKGGRRGGGESLESREGRKDDVVLLGGRVFDPRRIG